MPLTDTAIRSAKANAKIQKLFDGGGLYLELTPSGRKYWRVKFRYGGKENRLSAGVYPEVSLREARDSRDAIRRQLRAGINPAEARKALIAAQDLNAANSFELIAREWYEKNLTTWKPSHSRTILQRFENYVFPAFGPQPIGDVTAGQLLPLLKLLEGRGVGETAHRVLTLCGQVFRYAVATSRLAHDPTPALRGALTPVKAKHFAAITEPVKVGQLLRMLDGYQGSPIVRSALRLAPLVFVRPGELRSAKWADVNMDAAEWRFFVTKTSSDLIVPLCRQAVQILRELHPLTGSRQHVFPGALSNGRPMSNNSVLSALRRLGIEKDEMTGHGFRAMARTILEEVLHFPAHLIEQQLAHEVRDPLGRSYNRTTHLPERTRMMQAWADYLDQLRQQHGAA